MENLVDSRIQDIKIGEYSIGDKHPCFIIAEAGVNHNGDIDTAFEMIRRAKQMGADCVKFQTYKTESIVIKEAPKAKYQLQVTDKDESQYEMLKKLELSKNQFKLLFEECRRQKIKFLSTPYNFEDADLLEDIGVEAFKIASGQLVETPFIEYVAEKGLPMILSTGMATMEEVAIAVETIQKCRNNQIVLLQCTTNYPANITEANILAMKTMEKQFNLHTGYSDHVESNHAALAAVALGARILEKHFTLDRSMSGPDHRSSLNTEQFKDFILSVRAVEDALGKPIKKPSYNEKKNIEGMRRSLVPITMIKKGTKIRKDMLGFKRPATGISPKNINKVIGKIATCDIDPDTIITWDKIK